MADDGYFIGIDLGMTNSVLAYAREGEAPEIQHWEEGYSKFPSVVMVTPVIVAAVAPRTGYAIWRVSSIDDADVSPPPGRSDVVEGSANVVERYASGCLV